MTLLASLLLMTAATATAPVEAKVWPAEAVAQLEQCGFSDVSTYYDNDLQDDVIVMKDETASDEQLECAARTYLASGYWIEMPQDFQDRFFAHYRKLSAQYAKERSLRELEERGELALLPEYTPGQTDDAEFAQTLEMLCGDRAKGALRSDLGPHAISPQWVEKGEESIDESAEALACIMRFAAAADFKVYLVAAGAAVDPSGRE